MKLLSDEAYLCKNNKINTGTADLRKRFYLINPLKGSIDDLEYRLYLIMEINNTLILELSIYGEKSIYITNIGPDDTQQSGYEYAVYFSLEEAKGRPLGDGTYLVSEGKKWHEIRKMYMGKDFSLKSVIRKGLA